jgi:DnaJ-class molecular chaperone
MSYKNKKVIDQTFFEPETKKITIHQFSECIDCKGNGTVMVFDISSQMFNHQLCPTCRGYGEVELP